jgi:DNA-directed RNA polymerase subunit beta
MSGLLDFRTAPPRSPLLRPPRDGDGDGTVLDATSPRPATQPVESARAYPYPSGTRAFGDPAAIRTRIYTNVLAAARAWKPIQNQRHTLALEDIDYDDPEDHDIVSQKAAILRGETIGRRLRGDWVLHDNETGRELARKRTTIATVPYITPRGTFIQGGNEYTLSHQLRLRPGVYTRRKDNGELEAHGNVAGGLGHRIFLEPDTGIFRLQVGQAKMPLVPLLKAMGIPDRQLMERWGHELASTNLRRDDPSVIDKLHDRLVRGEAKDAPNRAQAVADAFAALRLDPDVMRRTLGTPYDHVTPELLLDVTDKLVAINKGTGEPDDRDHLAYMTLHGPEDLIAERLGRDRQGLRKVLWRASLAGSLKSVPTNLFTRSIQAALTSSGLGQPSEQINPAMIFEQQGRVSRMGDGGIPSLDAIPAESRNVQPSHFAFIDPLVTPESLRVGVDSRIAGKARKGDDGRIYSPFVDARTGQTVWKSPQDVADAVVAFPGELESGRAHVGAMVGGHTQFVRRDRVQYQLAHMEDAFSPITNLVPLKSAVKGQRAVMAGRMITQALPVEDAEAPLVQSGVPGSDGDSYENLYGEHMGALRSPGAGRVLGVDGDRITVQDLRTGRPVVHQLYNNFPYNRKTYLHQSPTVQPGQAVHPGDLLARSNYTDARGVTALGKNARVAYVPFRGLNFEDAIVVSDGFARRMRSQHMYQHSLDLDEGVTPGMKAHISVFPGKYDRKTLANFDADGVIRPGTVVSQDHPLILAIKPREVGHNALHRGRRASWDDQSVTWDHHDDGVVTDVAKTPKGIVVSVKTTASMEVGDKLSGRYGDKGVISAIIPDHEMPHGEDGQPFEVLLNPLGIISRTNPAQMHEAALGKIAALTGQAYRIQDFRGQDLNKLAMAELARHGLKDREDLIDPVRGTKIRGIFTGNRFFMKLHHTSESKAQGRGTAGYTMEGRPAKGGPEGSKLISLMDVNAILSHGATEVLRDAGAVRGQAHPDLWQQFMSGHKLPVPEVPLVHRKFVDMLRASGINVVREGTRLNVMALTDADIVVLAGDRELRSAETVDWKEGLKPVPGGLFDPQLTGGHNGNRWAFIRLSEPMPNPVMEEPIRRMLGLTEARFRAVLSGREELNGLHGPGAIRQALARIKIPDAIEAARQEIRSGRKGARDMAVRKLGFLKGAEKTGVHPRDWMLTRAPVLPPLFRPVSVMMGSKLPLVADPNYLYRELHDANRNLAEMTPLVGDLSEERLALYDAFKGVVGLGDPVHPKNQERQVKGLLRHVFGAGGPKTGMVQRKLIGTATDLVGRAVITPNPDLDMDQVGIPETRAWDVYRPFLVRRLVRRGMARLDAARHVVDRTDVARRALLEEMDARPVIINRAPVLHRYGVMGFRPRLTKGDTLQVSPLVVTGFGADFDGDAMQYHVPASDEAVADVLEKMLPSRNLLSVTSYRVHQLPSKEYGGGLYSATTAINKKALPRVYRTMDDVIRAWHSGDISVDHPVHIVEM